MFGISNFELTSDFDIRISNFEAKHMTVQRFGLFLINGFLTATIILAIGCTTTHNNKTIPKPSHFATPTNDFPTAIQAGIPATTLQK
jgi:hypothetical protein